ncbi:MAG: response regulator [Pseudomonadota bacterium]
MPLRSGGSVLPHASVDAAPEARRTALVIADDSDGAELIRMLLEAEGFAVVAASSVGEALALAASQTIDLITFDLMSPDLDGQQFLVRIRDGELLANVPVVVLAGDGQDSIGVAGGAAAVLEKPVTPGQLKLSLAGLGLLPVAEHIHTVLVVDDDAKAVELIAAMLPTHAYAVIRAYGGSEAIALATKLQPDLILLDLMMPDVTGFDVVRVLHGQPETMTIPILVVTAKDVTAADRDALSADRDRAIRIVEKSGFNKNQFLAEVRRALLPA